MQWGGSKVPSGGPSRPRSRQFRKESGLNIVTNKPTQPTGRLSGGKSASYVRAVNEPESRASRYTARYMLAGDIAYVLSAAELKCTPASHARKLLQALIEYSAGCPNRYDQASADIVSQREAWIEHVGAADAAWLHLGRNRGESLRCYLPRMYFRQTLHDERRAIVEMLRSLLTQAKPTLEAIAPNYHHLQHSGFTTLGEYLLSWAAVFEPHLQRIDQVDRAARQRAVGVRRTQGRSRALRQSRQTPRIFSPGEASPRRHLAS